MPKYDYRCNVNGQTVEVKHGMNEILATWGELCDRAGIAVGDTAPDSPVQRLITGGYLATGSGLGEMEAPACSTGACCPGGMCGLE